jgi:hypothetical protein
VRQFIDFNPVWALLLLLARMGGNGFGLNYKKYLYCLGVRVSIVVKALCYKPESRWSKTR